jgi:DNA-binding LacI/PurR family transcriptional regulator
VPLDVLSREVARLVREGVTGWVCAADHQAYRLVRDLRELGLRVPKDCSVTGYDGDPVPDGLPQLTTIKMPFRDIGVSSVVSLLRKIDHPTAPRRHILVSGREIYGESTGPAPKR